MKFTIAVLLLACSLAFASPSDEAQLSDDERTAALDAALKECMDAKETDGMDPEEADDHEDECLDSPKLQEIFQL
jgi:hypothetical protein